MHNKGMLSNLALRAQHSAADADVIGFTALEGDGDLDEIDTVVVEFGS